jgi:predicted neuraminidase
MKLASATMRCASEFLCRLIFSVAALLHGSPCRAAVAVVQEFIYEQAPFPECHASTIVETPQGLVAAWFGGLREGDPSVGIWLSRRDGNAWSAPVEVANGNQDNDPVMRQPCWNPVLHQLANGPLLLFYKVGPNPRQWWGMLIRSQDNGQTWTAPERLPEGILGPIKNKPLQLPDGPLLSGSSTELPGWRVHFEWSSDQAQTWKRTAAIDNGEKFGIIQPTLFLLRDGTVVAYCRSRQGQIVQTRSQDQGQSWSQLETLELPNPNSGIDGVTMADGRHALVYNHTSQGRTPLNLALAADDGMNWQPALELEREPGEYSYPAIIQTRDGLLHITYTWRRERIKHVVVDPDKLAN